MPRYAYERLSAQDNSFLVAEDANHLMHVAAIQIIEAGDLRKADGGIDVARYKRAIEAVLHRIPRYRQRLKWIPLQNRPVWVDDSRFHIDYHVRHSALPKPGGLEELRRLTARILTRKLDRARPLWEIWVIEGLEGDRFATVSKIHHCMIDGAAGADISQILMSPSRDAAPGEPPRFFPRPSPGAAELLVDDVYDRLAAPLRALRGAARALERPRELLDRVSERAQALGDLASLALSPSSATPINGPIGPHRNVDWLTMPLERVKQIRRAFECTVNDVVLAIVTGAVREYMKLRRVDPDELDFRVSAPVNMRGAGQRGQLGNFVSSWVVPLPLDESDPAAQLARVHEATTALKHSKQELGIDALMKGFEILPQSLFAVAARAVAGPTNMIVTNVPGPNFPLYLLGARLQEMVPFVPLLPGSGLGIALFSCDGRLTWGFNADDALVPDLGDFVLLVEEAFERLFAAALARQRAAHAASTTEPAAEAPVAAIAPTEPSANERRASVSPLPPLRAAAPAPL